MKQYLYKLSMSVLFTVVLASYSVANAQVKDTFILEQTAGLSLCREFQEILEAPENKGYMQKRPFSAANSSGSQKERWAQEQGWAREQRKNWRPLVIPEKFENFRLLRWEDVPEAEAREKLAHVINEWVSKGKKLGTDYIFKKSSIDVDRDGYTDVIYLREGIYDGGGHGHSRGYFMESGATAVKRFFEKSGIHFFYAQLVVYKGKPYFVKAGGPFRTNSVAILEPFSVYLRDAVNNKTTQEFSVKSVCQYNPVFE